MHSPTFPDLFALTEVGFVVSATLPGISEPGTTAPRLLALTSTTTQEVFQGDLLRRDGPAESLTSVCHAVSAQEKKLDGCLQGVPLEAMQLLFNYMYAKEPLEVIQGFTMAQLEAVAPLADRFGICKFLADADELLHGKRPKLPGL